MKKRVCVTLTKTSVFERVVDVEQEELDQMLYPETDDALLYLFEEGMPPASTAWGNPEVVEVNCDKPLTPTDHPEATISILIKGGMVQEIQANKRVDVFIHDNDLPSSTNDDESAGDVGLTILERVRATPEAIIAMRDHYDTLASLNGPVS